MGDTKGMNNVTVQSNVCPMECLTAGMAKHKWVDTATLRVNPWEQKGENTQGNIGTIRKDTLQWQHERRYKRVCPNKGAGGVDDVTIEKLVDYIREHWSCIKEQIRYREYKPQPVKRGELPKPNEDVRKLGIPTVMDRVIQQGIVRVISQMCEPMFSDCSYGFRPNRSCEMVIRQLLVYLNEGYEPCSRHHQWWWHGISYPQIPESRSHDIAGLWGNKTRHTARRKSFTAIVEHYVEWIGQRTGSKRTSLHEIFKVNREKSHTVSVFAIRNFKYLGFCYGKNGKGIYVRVHGKSWKKAKDKLRIGCFPKVRVNGLSRFKLQPERYD